MVEVFQPQKRRFRMTTLLLPRQATASNCWIEFEVSG